VAETVIVKPGHEHSQLSHERHHIFFWMALRQKAAKGRGFDML
jgi:hypothetical protein